MYYIQFILALIYLVTSQSFAQTDFNEKPKGVLDIPVEFTGEAGTGTNTIFMKEVRIGLFLPKKVENRSSQELLWAANLAVEEINENGGYQGTPFRLINRWSDNPWISGSKEMIRLVYQDSVCAVIGSIDGDATHIAEQIVTKAWVPLLSPLSADPTLTYIRIPWIFRLPPDYNIQSQVLIQEGSKYLTLKNVGLITESNHDGRTFAEEIIESMSNYQISPKFHFELSPSDLKLDSFVKRILSFNPNSIIICLSDDNIIKLLSELGNHTALLNILMPWIPGLNCSELSQYYSGDIYCIEPFLSSSNPAYNVFESNYKKAYDVVPSIEAAYTYDAVKILAHAVEQSGYDRIKLRTAIKEIKNFQGVTGTINWDNGGGNLAKPVLKKVGFKNK